MKYYEPQMFIASDDFELDGIDEEVHVYFTAEDICGEVTEVSLEAAEDGELWIKESEVSSSHCITLYPSPIQDDYSTLIPVYVNFIRVVG